ncbi:MAG: DNA polymerase [Dissulfurispiraceae bacterium]
MNYTIYKGLKVCLDLMEKVASGQLVSITDPFQVNRFGNTNTYNDINNKNNENNEIWLGLYACELGACCLYLLLDEYKVISKLLYAPKRHQIAVHGFKRILDGLPLGKIEISSDAITDTKLIAYLLNPGQEEHHYYLSVLTEEYLGMDYPYRIIEFCRRGEEEAIALSLSYDAYLIYRVAERLKVEMDEEVKWLYRYVEVPLAMVMAQMHRDGIGVDGVECAEQLGVVGKVLSFAGRQIAPGEGCNLRSGHDVFKLLTTRGVQFADTSISETQTVDDETLDELAPGYPLARKIRQWRRLDRMERFLRMGLEKERLYPSWHQTAVATGRVSCRNPPLQGIPRAMRKLLRPAPECVLFKADYSQMQLRILAHLSGDPALCEAFLTGKDVHQETAAKLGISRDKAKAVNFGIGFGMGAKSLSRKIGTSEVEGQAVIDQFFETYSGAKAFFEQQWEKLKRQRGERVIRSPFGRIRKFPGRLDAEEKRKMRVTLLQQVEADIVKIAMVKIVWNLKRHSMNTRIVMMIHDSAWLEAPEEEKDFAQFLMKHLMTTAVKLSVPLEVDWQ